MRTRASRGWKNPLGLFGHDGKPLQMERLITAVALEWNGDEPRAKQDREHVFSDRVSPCRCCGILMTDLLWVDPPTKLAGRREAVAKARCLLKAAIWNTQVARRAIPARKELVAAVAAMERIQRLILGDHEAISRAQNEDRKYPESETPEQLENWTLGGWCPPEAFFSEFTDFESSTIRTIRAAARFVKTANDVLEDIDNFIRALMLDPPPASGRPRIASVERYAYLYLAAVGLSAVETESALRDLVDQLRTAEEKIGLKQYAKSKRPASLASTIRRLLAEAP